MNKKFEFGDKVICKWQGKTFEALVIAHWVDSDTQGQESNWIEVVDKDGYKTDVGFDCVELIPHPDSSRLAWFENHLKYGTWPIIAWDNESEMFATILPNETVNMFDNIRSAIDYSLDKKAEN